MDMKIEITSKETIKPSSPTPDHLRTHKLTILDQFALAIANFYVPIILFYFTTSENSTETSKRLKKSLQETLAHFYPLAGRPKDYSYIDCNDAGATYIEARVAGNMEEVLKEPNLETLMQLLPINPFQNWIRISVPEMLLIQVNHFGCGGVAISVCISHGIADASTVGSFVKIWAAIARGDVCELDGVVTADISSLDPQTINFSSLGNLFNKEESLKGIVTNRFVFDGLKIAALKKKIGSLEPWCDLPTRFEALSALILGVLMSISEEKSSDLFSYISVDLRKRMNPPLPQECIGNLSHTRRLMSLSNDNKIDYNDLAQKIRASVMEKNDENVRRFHDGGKILSFVKNASQDTGKNKAEEVASFNSWCRMPFYEADFGWGKPTWVATALGLKTAYFLDTSHGEGVEVWLGLEPKTMSQFEQNLDIIEHSSFIPTE